MKSISNVGNFSEFHTFVVLDFVLDFNMADLLNPDRLFGKLLEDHW
jgi:hypothetical protein